MKNAALLAFAANLLDVDIPSVAAASSSGSSLGSSGASPVSVSSASSSRSSPLSTWSNSPSVLRPRRSSTLSCFLHHEGSKTHLHRHSQQPLVPSGCQSSVHQAPSPSSPSILSKISSRTKGRRRSSNRVRDASRFQAVAPRYYVSSSSEGVENASSASSASSSFSFHDEKSGKDLRLQGVQEGEDVLIYPDGIHGNGEFSLLKPYLEFNELDIQELFSKKGSRSSSSVSVGAVSSSLMSDASVSNIIESSSNDEEYTGGRSNSLAQSLSQLYDELEEVEIAHFHPTKEAKPSISPFFFADPTATPTPDTESSAASKSTTDAANVAPTPLPPWLTLNQSRFAPIKLRKLQRDLTPHLSPKEIDLVVEAIHVAAKGDYKKVAGAADFGSILVNSLEMTDVAALIASAFHYCSLVTVRERMAESAGSVESVGVGGSAARECGHAECSLEDHQARTHAPNPAEQACLHSAGTDAKYLCALAGSGIESFGSHAVKIALDAARLKSMETLAERVVRKNGKLGQLHGEDARNLRSLLLSVNDEGDWRALAIRSAACLYRLEGLEAHRSTSDAGSARKIRVRTPTQDESRASQEALHIYAPLAARLGMFRLKTELEDAAFRTLYPLSHAMVSALCGGENTISVGEGMKSVLSDITNQMKRLVQEDTFFMEHIESVSITARVKEPYSVWRKMLKMSKAKDGRICGKTLREISILDIPDAVALRVVFSARKLTPEESDATTRRREKELCYYILDLCQRTWPETSDYCRIKDYVSSPKENGYQSLHYSSRKRWRGSEWPFEVQIRSSEMHRIAEYGVAAHWSYKRNDIDGEKAHSSSSSHSSHKRLDKSSESYLKSVQEWNAKQVDPFASQEMFDPQPFPQLEDEIRRVRKRERDERLAPYLEALSGAQTDMTRENVFVFVSVQPPSVEDGRVSLSSSTESGRASTIPSEGTVLSLPRGSRVLDAVRVAEKWSSNLGPGTSRGNFVALRNGLKTSSMATEQLANGDVVSILPLEELSFR